MGTKYHIRITSEDPNNAPEVDGADCVELLSIRVDEDPTKQIMRLLSAEKRGPKKKGLVPAKTEGAK